MAGIYLSIPFCKTKCSYCNFASGVFARGLMQNYVECLCRDIATAESLAREAGGIFEQKADSVYLGGGTPSILEPVQLEQIFSALRENFQIKKDAEITVECAPGTISPAMLLALTHCGVNRVSLGVQSFVSEESRAVGRLHTAESALADVARLRAAGIDNINLDLIAGLPHQTAESWERSLQQAIASGVLHISVYMLEVDEDSRLGSELIAGGARYHAHFVPDDAQTAEFYQHACARLQEAGIAQYEISNFARAGGESRHNLKYWTRQPYLGFGVDAHSMLRSRDSSLDAVRIAIPDSLEEFMQREDSQAPMRDVSVTRVSEQQAWEETFFLGLRLREGVAMAEVARRFGAARSELAAGIAEQLANEGLATLQDGRLRLTPRGVLISNEVFERFLDVGKTAEMKAAAV